MATDKSASVLNSFTDYILGLMVCVFDENHAIEDERKHTRAEWVKMVRKRNHSSFKCNVNNQEEDGYVPPPAYSLEDTPMIIPKNERIHCSAYSDQDEKDYGDEGKVNCQ
eukprot:119326_1